MGELNAEIMSARPPYDSINVALELQPLDDLTIEDARPPVKTILGYQLHPLREQMETDIAAQDKPANDAEETKSEFLKLKQEQAAVDAQLEQIKKKDTRVADGLLFERGAHVGGKCLPVCPVHQIPVPIHKWMANVVCPNSWCTGVAEASPKAVRTRL
jgi:hypothetical protein